MRNLKKSLVFQVPEICTLSEVCVRIRSAIKLLHIIRYAQLQTSQQRNLFKDTSKRRKVFQDKGRKQRYIWKETKFTAISTKINYSFSNNSIKKRSLKIIASNQLFWEIWAIQIAKFVLLNNSNYGRYF